MKLFRRIFSVLEKKFQHIRDRRTIEYDITKGLIYSNVLLLVPRWHFITSRIFWLGINVKGSSRKPEVQENLNYISTIHFWLSKWVQYILYLLAPPQLKFHSNIYFIKNDHIEIYSFLKYEKPINYLIKPKCFSLLHSEYMRSRVIWSTIFFKLYTPRLFNHI